MSILVATTTENRTPSRVIFSLYATSIAIFLAMFSPAFSQRLLDLTGMDPLVLMLSMLAVVALLGTISLLIEVEAYSVSGDEFMMTVFFGLVGTIAAHLLLGWVVGKVLPYNGWDYVYNTATLEGAVARIDEASGKRDHPENRFIFEALSSTAAPGREHAAEKLHDLDLVRADAFKRLLMCSEILGTSGTPRFKLLFERGWASAEDLKEINQWAAANPPASTASSLQVEAWLRLAGEVDLEKGLSIPGKSFEAIQ